MAPRGTGEAPVGLVEARGVANTEHVRLGGCRRIRQGGLHGQGRRRRRGCGRGGRGMCGWRRAGLMVHFDEDIDLFFLLVEQVLELAHLALEGPDPFLEGLGVSTGKGASAELVTRPTLKADAGTLGARRPDAIAADLLAAASIAGLSNATLRRRPDFDHLHR